jgi:uncharacterized phage-associated protein
MARVQDVAAYILKKQGRMTTMKLQKLVYYAQAWHATWEDEALFRAEIQAWANGPVCPALYKLHRQQFQITARDLKGADCRRLKANERESIDIVLADYGNKTAQWLSDLTHREQPWLKTREGLTPLERSNRVISIQRMVDYYSTVIASA